MNSKSNKYFASEEQYGAPYDIYQLFQYYNEFFFNGELEKCTIKWTKRMTLCAGTCKYEGFGSSTISLSEPLLKFRSTNQLKQTILHQMIHAYLFKTNPAACQSQGGHGPAFVEIMNNINKITGLKLSVYHSFHDEVDFYRQHIWRCNGRCRDKPPFYGYVKRSMNRPPQPADSWFIQHQRQCGGQFSKIAEPDKGNKQLKENANKKKSKKLKRISEQKDQKKWGKGKTIQQYFKQMAGNKKQNSITIKEQSNTNYTEISQNSLQGQIMKKENIFASCKAKTLQEYCKQIQQDQKLKKK